MPRKKTTTIVEEEAPEEKDINYKEDIAGKSIEEVALDTPEEKVEAPVEEEKPAESETEEIEFDPEQLKKDAAMEAERSLLEKLKGGTPVETKENVDEYEQWAEQFAGEHNGQAPSWKEAFKWMEERAVTRVEERQQEKIRLETEATEKARGEEEARMVDVNKYVDVQFEDLYAANKLPRIQDKENPNDTGTLFRKALTEQTMLINKERLEKGLPTKTIKEVFFEDFKAPTRQPAGADAPVSAGRGATASAPDEEINYVRDIKNDSFLNSIFKRRG